MNAPEPYTVLICGGPFGIGSRISGSVATELSARDLSRLRATLAAGLTIEIRTGSEAAWRAMAPHLFRQLGVAAL